MQLTVDSHDSIEELDIAREVIERILVMRGARDADVAREVETAAFIAHEDRPDVGAEIPLFLRKPSEPDPATVFSKGYATTGDYAPAVPVPPVPPVPPTQTELDSEGLPWDIRIHASTKTKLKASGAWKVKKGTDPALVTQVKAEWRKLYPPPLPTVSNTAEAPVAGSVPLPPAIGVVPAAVPLPPVTLPPPASPEATAITASPSNPVTFVEIVRNVTHYMGAGKLTRESLKAALATVDVAELPMLAHRADLIPAAWAAISLVVTA